MIKMPYNRQRSRDWQDTPQLTCCITNAIQLSGSWLVHFVNISAASAFCVTICDEYIPCIHKQNTVSCFAALPSQSERWTFGYAAGVAKKQVTTKATAAAVAASTHIDLTAATTSAAAVQPGTEDLTERNSTTARHVSNQFK